MHNIYLSDKENKLYKSIRKNNNKNNNKITNNNKANIITSNNKIKCYGSSKNINKKKKNIDDIDNTIVSDKLSKYYDITKNNNNVQVKDKHIVSN